MFTKSFTFGLSMLLFLGGPAVVATKAIRLGKLVDGTGRVLTNAIVIVENDRIAAVTSAANTIPAGAEVVDLSRYTGIPGMIDAMRDLVNMGEWVGPRMLVVGCGL